VSTVPTGTLELDKALLNGLPQGFTMLVLGRPGSGMELFAKQFAGAGAGKDNVVYFSTNEREEAILNVLRGLGKTADTIKVIDLGSRHYQSTLANELRVSQLRLEGVKASEIIKGKVESKKAVNFVTLLMYEISRVAAPFRIVLDSLDFFLEHYEVREVISIARTLESHAQHEKGVGLVTMLGGVYETKTQSAIEGIVDVVIELEPQAKGREQTVHVRKVRNFPEKVTSITARVK
jgi:KaiC/GvpD/RAD55 family RecA-like ATPase